MFFRLWHKWNGMKSPQKHYVESNYEFMVMLISYDFINRTCQNGRIMAWNGRFKHDKNSNRKNDFTWKMKWLVEMMMWMIYSLKYDAI